MHESSMLRMQWFKENYFKNLDKSKEVIVLDVGSQAIFSHPTYKSIFRSAPFKYIGLDIEEGHNVDIAIKNPYQWGGGIPDEFCDVIISGQMFEHVEFPWITISEMARVLKPQGKICIIAPSMARLHRFPVHCQNYFSDGLIALAKYAGLEVLHASTNYAPKGADPAWYDSGSQDSMLIAQKPLEWRANNFDVENYICEAADLEAISSGFVPIEQQEWDNKYMTKRSIKRTVLYPFDFIRRACRKVYRTFFKN